VSSTRVHSGLDVLVRDRFQLFRGKRIGLITHPAAVDREMRHVGDLLLHAPNLELVALFGPEHGLFGTAQDLISVRGSEVAKERIRIVSLYGDTFDSLKPAPAQLTGVDALVIDLQDVGSRFYTFQATMLLCMQAASEIGLPVWVLDRPNPLGGDAVEGPTIAPGYESFVGIHPIAVRHGMTIGELARLYHAELELRCELSVVACEGWRRSMWFDETGLPWVMPSPNMPTLDTAAVYPGQCLLEGTNLSEGRGTTRPFELCGAPGIDPRAVVDRLNSEQWPGVRFRPVWFQPTFQKHAGAICGGVQFHVLDRPSFQPVRTGAAVLIALREAARSTFDWRQTTYEFVSDRLAIDLLFGSPRERLAIEAGIDARGVSNSWAEEERQFRNRRQNYLIYD